MCGIIGYIGKPDKVSELPALLSIAFFNVHRGNDGVGSIHYAKDKWVVNKKHFTLEELTSKKLLLSRVKKEERIGDIQVTIRDDVLYDKEQTRFESEMEEFHKLEANKLFIHHRKGTTGSDTKENLHPIELNGKYYMHNGTVYGLEPIKKWMELNANTKFKTDLDTEIIVTLYQQLQKKFNNDNKKVFKMMKEFFPNGWGVIIEFSPDGNITLIKDCVRSLWAYMSEEDGILVVSEPTPLCCIFEKVILLSDGIYPIDDKMKGEDYTEKCKRALDWWDESDKITRNSEPKKCETCAETKNTVCTFHCKEHPDTAIRNEICFSCLVSGISKDELEIEQQEWMRMAVSESIGDLE